MKGYIEPLLEKNMKLFVLGFMLSVSFSTFGMEKIIGCENDKIAIYKECSLEGQFPQKYVCRYVGVMNLDDISRALDGQRDLDLSALDGYGNFRFIGNGNKISHGEIVEKEAFSGELFIRLYKYSTRGSRVLSFEKKVQNCESLGVY